jgi:crotonobetainyl-CoA:carnitine CoA-transferase CaiB-like acyl-CoA transferase
VTQGPTTAATGPLTGVRIIDLSAVISGPFGTTMLADQGADVITVENPAAPDMVRNSGPVPPGAERVSAMYAAQNRNKRSIMVDLKQAAGIELVKELIGHADVVVQNFRPGAMERLGLGWDVLGALNSDLILCSITGFGEDGPYAMRPAFDPVIQALAAYPSIQADADGTPQLVAMGVCDKITSLHVAQAISAALFARANGAGSQRIDIAMLDVAVHFSWVESMWNHVCIDHELDFPDVYHLYRTSDGWAMLHGIATDAQWASTCRALGVGELIDDHRFVHLDGRLEHGKALHALLQERTVTMTSTALVDLMVAADVPVAPINSPEQLIEDPHIRHRGLLVERIHPTLGHIREARPPVRFSATPSNLRRHAPRPGEHTDELLAEVLGMTDARVSALRDAGVIA